MSPGQIIRHVRPPFIPERLDYFRWMNASQAKSEPQGPSYFVISESLDRTSVTYGYNGPNRGIDLGSLLQWACALRPYEVSVPPRREQ